MYTTAVKRNSADKKCYEKRKISVDLFFFFVIELLVLLILVYCLFLVNKIHY